MIRIVHPGSGCWLLPIPDPGSKGHKSTLSRIPDPDPQHCFHMSLHVFSMGNGWRQKWAMDVLNGGLEAFFLKDLWRNVIAKAISVSGSYLCFWPPGSASGSVSQRYGSEDPDPHPGIRTNMPRIPNSALGSYSKQRIESTSDLADPKLFFLVRYFKSRSGCTVDTSLFPFWNKDKEYFVLWTPICLQI